MYFALTPGTASGALRTLVGNAPRPDVSPPFRGRRHPATYPAMQKPSPPAVAPANPAVIARRNGAHGW